MHENYPFARLSSQISSVDHRPFILLRLARACPLSNAVISVTRVLSPHDMHYWCLNNSRQCDTFMLRGHRILLKPFLYTAHVGGSQAKQSSRTGVEAFDVIADVRRRTTAILPPNIFLQKCCLELFLNFLHTHRGTNISNTLTVSGVLISYVYSLIVEPIS